jgi:hypothetical protein
MAKFSSPWASGPGEILKHGLELLQEDSDTKRRLAMISIDNAIELMIKIYLGLPQRVTGLKISRKDYQEFSESFPLLLDALQKYASDKLDGIDPRWSPENRPYVVTSKPANGVWPGLVVFTLLPSSCLLDFD